MPRILVADDNTNIQKMVVLAFEERGVEVVAVGNGEAAVRKIPDVNPDLVLADVFMPVRNGYEVCEFVKKDTRFAHVPVILLVGAFDPLDEKEARRVGADGVLKKPFVPPDPLIAMVMSALEKNPKVAAELAKAREVPVAPPPPPEMEIAAKAEPKPLPHFPEPTAEEAAAIYGFGKGVRSLDDEAEEAEAKGPKAPVAKAEADNEEDDFDGAATATDWRRTGGMDFEIPENTAVDPAYSYGKDLAPITFPSEKEVPPRRIRVRDDELDDLDEPVVPFVPPAPLAQQIAPKPVISALSGAPQQDSQSFAPYGMKLSTEPSATEDAPAAWHESPAFQSASNQPATPKAEPPAAAPTAAKEEAPAPAQAKESTPAPAANISAPAHSATWTDLMAPPPSEYPEGSWMTDSHPAPVSHVSEPAASKASEPEFAPELVASAPAPAHMAPGLSPAPAWQAEPAPTASTESQWHSERAKERESDPEESRPRKKSWFSDAIEAVREVVHGGSNEPVEQPISASHTDSEPDAAPGASTALVVQSNAPAIAQTASQFEDHSHSQTKSSVEAELLADPADTTPSRKDPDLEEPPPAHVAPEPLLVRDDPHATSGYGQHPETIAPLQSFPLPGEVEPVNGEPAADLVGTNHEEDPAFAATETPTVDVPAPADFGDRIPTAPPPNREALSGIPFLMPTAATLESVNALHESPAPSAAAANVDEMVQKVLERLEPQLHELLSKSLLKPLVENMLQNELAKKEK
ncbi:MAG: response regulator [Candidatus Acidiferrales bacterium]